MLRKDDSSMKISRGIYINDDSDITFQVIRSLVADFTDEMVLLTSGIGREMDIDDATLRIINSEFLGAYLRLLPPQELNGITIRVFRM